MIKENGRTENEHAYFSQLDGLRFLAVSAVMFGHWANVESLSVIKRVFAAGGVNLFFVLSGFLITQILIRSRLSDDRNGGSHWFSIRQFYIRRSLRIFPIYYLVIFIGFAINMEPARESIGWLLSYSTNIYWSIGGSLGAYGHLWSLGVEEQFYLCFPFIVLFIPIRYYKKVFLSLIVLAIIGRLVTYLLTIDQSNHVGVYALMPNCLDSLCLGSMLAFYSVFDKEKLKKILEMRLLFIFCFLLFLVCYLIMQFGNDTSIFVVMFYRFFFSVCCFWIIGVSVTRGFKGVAGKFLENSKIAYLGRISYGLYLYHHFMPELLAFILNSTNSVLPFSNYYMIIKPFIFFSMTLGISMLSWHLFEAPLNRLKQHFNYKEK